MELPDDTSKNIQTISFLVGKCFFHVNAARVGGFEIEKAVNIFAVWGNSRIWPVQRTTKPWPHRPLLDERGVNFVSTALERLIHATRDRWV